jgi:hypothetical protein
MDTVLKRRSILRLTGIRLADCVDIEEVADGRLLEGTEPAEDPASYSTPDKIPSVFTGLDTWPTNTNLRCWSCGFTFDDSPKFVARYAREGDSGGIEFGVLGNMCTFNCAERWIESHLGGRASNEERWRYQDNLCLAYLMFTGRRVSRIAPAPDRTELLAYGGELDEDAFWKRQRELDPAFGLRDHTPGSIVPERDRPASVLATLRARSGSVTLPASAGEGDMWGLCGVDSVDIDDKNGAAPIKPAAAPTKVATMSAKAAAVSAKAATTSAKAAASPAKVAAPPVKVAAPPELVVTPPAKATAPPAKIAVPPELAVSPPAKATAPPAKATAPPAKATAPPAKATAPPAKVVAPPANVAAPPAKVAAPPAKVATPPAKIVAPPAKATAPPAKATAPPAKIVAPPAKAAAPPAKAAELKLATAPPDTAMDDLLADMLAM